MWIDRVYILFEKIFKYFNHYLAKQRYIVTNKEAKRLRGKKYIKYSFNITKMENIKIKKKISVKY